MEVAPLRPALLSPVLCADRGMISIKSEFRMGERAQGFSPHRDAKPDYRMDLASIKCYILYHLDSTPRTGTRALSMNVAHNKDQDLNAHSPGCTESALTRHAGPALVLKR